MDLDKARDLLQRYRNGDCSPAEIRLIEQWFDQLAETGEAPYSEQEIEDLQQTMENRLLQQIGTTDPETRPRSLYRSLRWVAAAAIILGLGTSAWFLLQKNQVQPPQASAIVVQDVQAPASNRARITLANGQQVYLDEAASGQLATQGNVKIIKTGNGEITYQATDGILKDVPVNILSNPRGSKVAAMTLADGTRVWLNAGSSLTYPVAFTGKERQVSITGEAYFEVAENKQLPFIVKKDALTIQVLGTHFNVNAFDEESSSKVTLLEGAVNVAQGAKNIVLKPGQQALLSDGSSKVLNEVDLDEVMAWKNGLFIFKGENIHTIMRQLERWYDVDVQFEKSVTEKFYVKMNRNTQVSNVFKILEATGGVHFEIKGKKIIVKP